MVTLEDLINRDEEKMTPENAEDLSEAFTYSDLMNEVVQWKKDNEDYFIEHNTDIWAVLDNMFESLSWEFPSTFLDQLDY